ncbi:hypothetical protein Pcinc_026122 [Petrolisthes cinctipes]|uniref:Uncharacterized protein n=1 Tax=Petrolisthes cinctipes TaxID=88211 RepID=A0AAE1K8H7_PETCI|nr:hypothetical protein Pcinc_026122 [Petrolisthes cinctipes]
MEQALTGVGHGGKKGQQGGAGIQGGTGRQAAGHTDTTVTRPENRQPGKQEKRKAETVTLSSTDNLLNPHSSHTGSTPTACQ